MWKFTDWSHCTVSCGGGIQRMQVFCVEQEAGIVEDHYCNKIPKPDDKINACNDHICPAMYVLSSFVLELGRFAQYC
jgi:hypothetical protein